MRRRFLFGLCLVWATLAAGAACSSFSSDETGTDAGGGDETGTAPEAALPDAATADVITKPGTTCPLVPTAPPCTSGCEDKLPLLPPSSSAPGTVLDARIAVRGDTVYVARAVDKNVVEVFSKDTASAGWSLRGSFPAHGVFGLAVNDTMIVVSLQETAPDGALTNQQLGALDLGCDASCTGMLVTLPDSMQAGPGAVTIGQNFYLSASHGIVALKGGVPSAVTNSYGAPSIAADCTYVYYSNAFDHSVRRFDEATGMTTPIANEVGIFDAAVYDGAFPGTFGLAAGGDSVFATTGSGQVYAMPKDPLHDGQVIVPDAGLGSIIAADNRYVYYAEGRGFLVSAIVRVQPDGGDRHTLSSVLRVTGMASDADHLYVIEAGGQVTRLKK
jgi:hypothetical protein